jgi:regulator of protease activity HflC (stomatin/prohibitin superfamily)
MYPFTTVKIRSFERAFLFREGELVRVLGPGKHRFWDPGRALRADVLSAREPWIRHPDLDVAVRSGQLAGLAEIVALAQHERALVWIDGRLEAVLGPGLHALWTALREVRVDRLDGRQLRFDHPDLSAILATTSGSELLERLTVPQGGTGLVYAGGALVETLGPGQYAFWKRIADLKLYTIERRETMLDLSGQDIMTRDKVTLRMNALLTYKVIDAAHAVSSVEDYKQALYREAQLALRAAVGARPLDELLIDKEAVAGAVAAAIRERAAAFGLEVTGFGLRDLILPGDMKELLNKVIEAQKAAEAAVITRREETAAIRNQVNTARLLEGNPTLMRLRELEVIEKIAQGGKLNVIVGEKGLGDRLLSLV